MLRLPAVSETWMTDEVPLIIHHTAPADKSRWAPLWHDCRESFYTNFPESSGYKHVMWNDDDIDTFVREVSPDFYSSIYQKYARNIQRIDVVRYFIMFMIGGIYADMDVLCYKNFHHLLPPGKASIAESSHEGEAYQNALMASPAHHPFWHYVFMDVLFQSSRCIDPNNEFLDTIERTGPSVIIRAVEAAPAMMFNALPKAMFMPSNAVHRVASSLDELKYKPSESEKDSVYAYHVGTGHWGGTLA